MTNTCQGSPSLLVSLDLSSAFDCIIHRTLVQRLSSDFALSGDPLLWLGSYLHNRSQYVYLNGNKSRLSDIVTGVPQGSVLGPLLFTAYVSPISRLIDSFGISHHAYADDTSLYLSFDKSLSGFTTLNDCTLTLSRWFLFNGFLLNPTKSEAIWTGSRVQVQQSKVYEPHLKIADDSITSVNNLKIIGVTFDCHLSFTDHITEICRAANFHLRALSHIRKYLDDPTASMLATCIVGSRIDYCNSILAGISSYNIHRLQTVQNKAAKIVTRSRGRVSCSPLLRQLHWLPVCHRIDYKVALITFKTLTTTQPSYLSSLLIPYTPSRSLRSSNQHLLFEPLSKSALHSRSFSISAPKLWNRLPPPLRALAFSSPSCPGSTSTDLTLSISSSLSPSASLFNHSLNLNTFKHGLKTYFFGCPLLPLAV